MSGEDLLTTADAAPLLFVSPWTLVAWRRQRRGPTYHRIGKRILYRRADLTAFIQSGRVQPGNGAYDDQ